jgi:hypothetical protein
VKLKNQVLVLLIFLLSCLLSATVAAGFLLTYEFENITNNSVLKYLIDKEIRNLPSISEGTNVIYKSYPADGTSRGFDAVRFDIKDQEVSYKKIADYFTALGYTRKDNGDFFKNQDKIIIEQSGNSIEITKYSRD